MTEYAYFKDLTPRQQLNDLMHKYAQMTDSDYGAGWKELEKRYLKRYGEKLSILKWKHEQDNQTKITMPAFLETRVMIHDTIEIGHNMTGGILKGAQ